MEERTKYQFPIIIIKDVSPLLHKGEKVFAYQIEGVTENNRSITFYENKGLDLSAYVGAELECLLEITRGSFEYRDEGGEKPDEAFVFQYQWQKRIYEYFPELKKIREDLLDANSKEEVFLQEQFEKEAAKLFNEWGLNGLNIGIYQDKPLLSSANGYFLLNEYEFEEEIDALELGQEVYIKIEEAFLRGIRPCEAFIRPEPKQEYVQKMQKDEPTHTKRRLLF